MTTREGEGYPATGGTGLTSPGRAADFERTLSETVPPERLVRDAPMREHTSFRVGGPADYLVTVETATELLAVLGLCRSSGVPFLVLGRGTNLLVRDGGIRGVVVRLGGEFLAVESDDARVRAGAGVALADLARRCGRRGLSGLEFAVGIPGTVGGAVVMNAGAYGSEMRDVLSAAECVRPDRLEEGVRTFPAAELDLAYRTSRPQREGWVVVSAVLALRHGDPDEIRRREEDFTVRRRARQPLDLPSAGSVFKRPAGFFAGTLIEEAGCKGWREGDAQVSELHAGFIVNRGAATARDVLRLIERVRQAVFERSGVWLEPEIRVVGEDLAVEK